MESQIPHIKVANQSLAPFQALIGEWRTAARHPMFPNQTFNGRTTFEWTEGGAFLVMRSEIDQPAFPTGVAIIGTDDNGPQFTMLYFDERGVSRVQGVSFEGNVWKWWRSAPGFSQRMTCTIAPDGDHMTAKGELSTDDSTWGPDLDLEYTRVR